MRRWTKALHSRVPRVQWGSVFGISHPCPRNSPVEWTTSSIARLSDASCLPSGNEGTLLFSSSSSKEQQQQTFPLAETDDATAPDRTSNVTKNNRRTLRPACRFRRERTDRRRSPGSPPDNRRNRVSASARSDRRAPSIVRCSPPTTKCHSMLRPAERVHRRWSDCQWIPERRPRGRHAPVDRPNVLSSEVRARSDRSRTTTRRKSVRPFLRADRDDDRSRPAGNDRDVVPVAHRASGHTTNCATLNNDSHGRRKQPNLPTDRSRIDRVRRRPPPWLLGSRRWRCRDLSSANNWRDASEERPVVSPSVSNLRSSLGRDPPRERRWNSSRDSPHRRRRASRRSPRRSVRIGEVEDRRRSLDSRGTSTSSDWEARANGDQRSIRKDWPRRADRSSTRNERNCSSDRREDSESEKNCGFRTNPRERETTSTTSDDRLKKWSPDVLLRQSLQERITFFQTSSDIWENRPREREREIKKKNVRCTSSSAERSLPSYREDRSQCNSHTGQRRTWTSDARDPENIHCPGKRRVHGRQTSSGIFLLDRSDRCSTKRELSDSLQRHAKPEKERETVVVGQSKISVCTSPNQNRVEIWDQNSVLTLKIISDLGLSIRKPQPKGYASCIDRWVLSEIVALKSSKHFYPWIQVPKKTVNNFLNRQLHSELKDLCMKHIHLAVVFEHSNQNMKLSSGSNLSFGLRFRLDPRLAYDRVISNAGETSLTQKQRSVGVIFLVTA